MELLKFRSFSESSKKPAIIQCSQNRILRILTSGEVAVLTNKIREFVLKNIKANHICIGLLMDKNVYIPSVILSSLQQKQDLTNISFPECDLFCYKKVHLNFAFGYSPLLILDWMLEFFSLCMEKKNIYFKFSFQVLGFSFVFLRANTLIKTVQNLNIKWVLSYESGLLNVSFILEDVLQLSVTEELKLWKNNTALENVTHLCFQGIFSVVQTSGSTGENKIVRVPHSCIEKNVLSLNKHFKLSNTDVIYWGTPLTFDPTLVEFLLGVFCQCTLLIVPKLVSLNPKFLYEALFKIGQATFLQIVPSLFLRWNKEHIANILRDSCLRTLAFGGESFPSEILEYDRQKKLKIFNLYGVTELSCWATISNIPSESIHENHVLLGDALDDTFIELRDQDKPVHNGVGEIFIGSQTRYCLINDSEEKVNFPFVVKTGDLGEFTDRGLVYRGRKTRIIKRFGHKVNLHKIEEIIYREINLSSRLVYSVNHNKLLVFILIEEYFNRNTKIRLLDKLRVKLLKIIPDTEFPDFIDVLVQYPLNEHGKICDKILEKYYEQSLSNLDNLDNLGLNTKDVFINILDRYLKTEFSSHVDILAEHTFFELGGNSILAMQFLMDFKEHIGRDIPGELVTLILNENIKSCINYVQENVWFKRKGLEEVLEEPKKKMMLKNNGANCVIWMYDLKGCVDSPPLVFKKSNETYIATGSFTHVFAILKESGEEYLKLTLPREVEAKPCASKCGSFIFIGCSNGSMYCINLSLKVIDWEYDTLQKISSAACLCRESNAIVFGSYDNFVYCLCVEDGSLCWKTELLGSIRADPLYSGTLKTIYVGTTRGMCYALNEETGTVVWSYKLDGPIFGSPCLVNKCVIWPCVNGMLYGISTTAELKWTQNINGHIFSSLTACDNKIYFGCHDSRLYEITLADNNPSISKYFQLESEISSTPFVYKFENKVFIVCVCNLGCLYVVDPNSGNQLFTYQLPAQSFSSPYVFNNMVYVGCRDNNLYCIDIKKAIIN